MMLTVVVVSEVCGAKVLNSLSGHCHLSGVNLYCKETTAYSAFKASIFIRFRLTLPYLH